MGQLLQHRCSRNRTTPPNHSKHEFHHSLPNTTWCDFRDYELAILRSRFETAKDQSEILWTAAKVT